MTLLAIDGPGGSGKSTLAKVLAIRLGVERLDTGAMYRAITAVGLARSCDLSNDVTMGSLARSVDLVVGETVHVDGIDVTDAIRSPEIDAVVSIVAALPSVREALVERQREWAHARPSAVVEGRDIGTVVLPDATLKIFLTADPAVRAARRAIEQSLAGGSGVTAVAQAMAVRDATDSSRTISPLAPAADAVVIDTSNSPVEAIADEVIELLRARR